MLARRIYIMSLEHPGPGFTGFLGKVGEKNASLYALDHFVTGYGVCQDEDSSNRDYSWQKFLEWLRPQGYYPTGGWAWKIINECGDGDIAFSRLAELLYEYLENEMPQWFIEFNSTTKCLEKCKWSKNQRYKVK